MARDMVDLRALLKDDIEDEKWAYVLVVALVIGRVI